MSNKQICKVCKIQKSINDFSFHKPGLRRRKCKVCHRKVLYKWRLKNNEKVIKYRKDCGNKLRFEIFKNYGLKCRCCGEDQLVFLTIDHIHNDGYEQRKELRLNAGQPFYYWLKRNNFPKGFQTLCHNCNHAKRIGICPHKKLNIKL